MAWATKKRRTSIRIEVDKPVECRSSRSVTGRAAAGGPVEQVVVWTLRALLHAAKETRNPGQVLARCDDAMRLAGFEPLGFDEAKRPGALHAVRQALESATAQPPNRDDPLYRNVDRLGEILELAPVEREILAFAVKCATVSGMVEPFALLLPTTRCRLARALAAVLCEFDPQAIKTALEPDGALVSCGLVRWSASSRFGPDPPLVPMDDLDTILGTEYPDDKALLAPFFRVTSSANLTAADFPHLAADIDLICRFLGRARRERRPGVNVLLFGQPGTGKTELARVLAAQVGEMLYEVNVAHNDGSPLDGKHRLGSYLLCQRFLSRLTHGLVLFDEAEDLFPSESFGMFGLKMRSAQDKGFTNRLLEENAVPAIWVTNSVEQIDRAVLRRFDFQLEVRTPPRSVRCGIVRRHLAGLPIGDAFVERLADCEEVSPADVKAAAKVAALAGGDGPAAVETTMERVIRRRVEARGGRLETLARDGDAIPYRIEYLNASRDPARLAEALRDRPRGNVLLFGPPGTGKTAYTRHLARRLDRPLLARRASDLLNPFVGVTEKLIAEMFQQAREERAVLLLDEADSFLRDRRGAVRSWEVTQVNELLVGMEQFDGLFVCSTNLVDDLDQAAFRRFVVKVRFDYLRSDQAWAMFQALCTQVNATPDAGLRGAVGALRNLTPGDFATVHRQIVLGGEPPSPSRILQWLEEECRMKRDGDGTPRGIGFRG
ncbi:MAG: ATP-binding protein [Myxococcales bacterium]|nr:ATP-binding protein [Myxococcales bacterium]